MLTTIIRCISYAGFFYLGRLSYLWWRNKVLDAKKEEAIAYAQHAAELLEEVKAKDLEVRKKWQMMVNDISQYQFADMPNKHQWTDLDQMYLDSWSSAEKKQ